MMIELGQDRERKRRRFSGASLSASDDISPFKD